MHALKHQIIAKTFLHEGVFSLKRMNATNYSSFAELTWLDSKLLKSPSMFFQMCSNLLQCKHSGVLENTGRYMKNASCPRWASHFSTNFKNNYSSCLKMVLTAVDFLCTLSGYSIEICINFAFFE